MSKYIYFLGGFSLISLMIFLCALPVGSSTQLVLSITVLSAMVILWPFRANQTLRMTFIFLGLVIVVRYVYWRTTATLPPIADPSGFIPGVVLYAAELYCIAMMGLSVFIVADPLQRKSPPLPTVDSLPTVDVFVPTYNESIELLATTLAAARSLDYPADKLTVYLLDDGGTDQKCQQDDIEAAEAARFRRAELMSLCEDLGVHYHARERNEHAKAGNLNAGLTVSRGEFVAVFDADHAPVREFLKETIGHFSEDDQLFLVQTPHFFLNPDPIEKNLSTFGRMPSENEMFYSITQRGLDKWNAAFFCGSAAVLRRAALLEAGGFSGRTITEDCETALELHSRGWNSRYVDKPLIAGLQPETLDSFMGQRSRWCRGMIQILMLKNPLLKRGLSLPQRLCYLSTSLFWLFPLPRLIFMTAPLMYLFFGLKLYVANIEEFFAYTLTYIAISVMMQNYLYGKVRWPWVSELYEYIQSFFLAQAIFAVLLNPLKPTFNVTAKGMTLEADHVSSLARPYVIFFGLIVAGVAMTAWRYHVEPATAELTLFVGGWNVFNLFLAGAALGAIIERRERRRTHRLAISRTGTLWLGGGEVRVAIDDASIGGIRVRPLAGQTLPPLPEDEPIWFTVEPQPGRDFLPWVGMRACRASFDAKGPFLGLEFGQGGLLRYQVAADLMFATGDPLQRFQMTRRTGENLVAGTLRFLGWGISRVGEFIRFALTHRGPETSAEATNGAPQAIKSTAPPSGRIAA